MAKQVQQNQGGVLSKVAQRMRQAHEAHKNDETEYSKFGELPEGLEGAIARLVEAKFDVYKEGNNKGEPYFYAAGVVVTPDIHVDKNGTIHRIEGLRTAIGPIPLCDTKNSKGEVTTLDQHVARMYNELRKLGLPTATIAFDQLEPTVAKLKAIGPYFKFRTWKGKPTEQYPDPRVNHDWQGVIQYSATSNGAAGSVKDNTAAAPAASPQQPHGQRPAAPAAPTPPAAPKGPRGPQKAAPTPPPAPEKFDEFGDLASLVERANADDPYAQNELSSLAEKAGVADEATNAQTWQEVADLIMGTQAGDGSGDGTGSQEQGDAGEWAPAVKEVYAYRPLDPKTKQPAATQVLAQVLEVDNDARTVKLGNTKNAKQTWKDVSWDALESAG